MAFKMKGFSAHSTSALKNHTPKHTQTGRETEGQDQDKIFDDKGNHVGNYVDGRPVMLKKATVQDDKALDKKEDAKGVGGNSNVKVMKDGNINSTQKAKIAKSRADFAKLTNAEKKAMQDAADAKRKKFEASDEYKKRTSGLKHVPWTKAHKEKPAHPNTAEAHNASPTKKKGFHKMPDGTMMKDSAMKQKVDPDAPGTPGKPGYEPPVKRSDLDAKGKAIWDKNQLKKVSQQKQQSSGKDKVSELQTSKLGKWIKNSTGASQMLNKRANVLKTLKKVTKTKVGTKGAKSMGAASNYEKDFKKVYDALKERKKK